MAEIKKVVIEAGGKEFSLSVEEAKALRDILNATFPEEQKPDYIQEIKKQLENNRTPYIPQPIIIERYPLYYPHYPWTVTYGSGTVYCSTTNSNSTTL